MARDLHPNNDAATVEGAAAVLRWAMTDLINWRAPRPVRGNHIFRSADEMSVVWQSHGAAEAELPRVNFDLQMVVATFEDAGRYNSARTVSHVIPHDGVVWVVLGVVSRPWKMINPSSVIAVARAEGVARFVENGTAGADYILSLTARVQGD